MTVQKRPRGAAKSEVRGSGQRSYPESKVRGGGREELPRVRGQRWPGEATSRPRPGAVALRSHPVPEARGRCREEQPKELRLQEGLEELSHVEGQEGQQ